MAEQQPTGDDFDSGFEFYHYDPSLPAALIFVVIFAVSSAIHGYQLVKHRTWYFIPFFLGGICEALGYGGRIISSTETPLWTMGPYVLQTILILIAAAMFAASIYMVLGRLVRLLEAEHLAFIPVRWTSKIFVTADVISILMQGAGGAMLAIAETPDAFKTGENIIIGGLFVQLAGFGVFIAVAGVFYARITKNPTRAADTVDVPWRSFLWVMFGSTALILFRSLFRLIEYLQGNDGYLMSREVFLYIFDAILMMIVMVLYNFYHPSRIIASSKGTKKDAFQSVYSSEVELQTV
ncbi:hypothetical protein DL764_008311 [Monosporascus ibericus]|uniref:RTA1 like protein n=1 Tax=Monosporascus ibericus TaxID=155417 RepID=A0A4Q4SXT8_9PEZI|nr:hypothetical protein DL764_008311 [Monosporascus ibericus]